MDGISHVMNNAQPDEIRQILLSEIHHAKECEHKDNHNREIAMASSRWKTSSNIPVREMEFAHPSRCKPACTAPPMGLEIKQEAKISFHFSSCLRNNE
jgi:hypothetical protein